MSGSIFVAADALGALRMRLAGCAGCGFAVAATGLGGSATRNRSCRRLRLLGPPEDDIRIDHFDGVAPENGLALIRDLLLVPVYLVAGDVGCIIAVAANEAAPVVVKIQRCAQDLSIGLRP